MLLYFPIRRFQFYDSPIKRTMRTIKVIDPQKFQFYDSPIKSMCRLPRRAVIRCSFNSMIVRLKELSNRWYQCIPYEVSIL